MAPDDRFHFGRRPALTHDDRQVALDHGESADLFHFDGPGAGNVQATDGQLRHDDTLRSQLPCLDRVGVQLRDSARERLGVGRGFGHQGATGMHRVAACIGLVDGRGQTEPVAEQLHDALCVVEVVAAGGAVPGRRGSIAGDQERQPGPLARALPHSAVALADLEDGHVLPSLMLVERQNVQQARGQMPAQHRMLAGKRVGDGDWSPLRRIRHGHSVVRPLEARLVLRRHQRMRHNFGQARAGESLSNGLADPQRRGAVGRHQRVGQVSRRGLVAADAGNLLGHVRLDGQVAAPRGHHGYHHFL